MMAYWHSWSSTMNANEDDREMALNEDNRWNTSFLKHDILNSTNVR